MLVDRGRLQRAAGALDQRRQPARQQVDDEQAGEEGHPEKHRAGEEIPPEEKADGHSDRLLVSQLQNYLERLS